VAQLEASPVAVLRDEKRAGFAQVTRQLQALEQRLEQGLEETRRHMRVRYEDLVTRIASIGEGGPPSNRKSRRTPPLD
jgi:hypothetical protein